MELEKVTAWYPPPLKPEVDRIGEYEVTINPFAVFPIYRRHWNGAIWIREDGQPSDCQTWYWRGLAWDPNPPAPVSG